MIFLAKKRAKKLNPRRVPMSKSMIDLDGILEEATRDDMYHAWLLVFNALIERGKIKTDEIPALADDVTHYTGNSSFPRHKKEDEITRAENIMGIPTPYTNLSPDNIKSLIDLERFKQRIFKNATHIALCVICLGLDFTGCFTEDELRQIFFNVDLTLSEIDHGCNSFAFIENALNGYGLKIERVDDDIHCVSIVESEH